MVSTRSAAKSGGIQLLAALPAAKRVPKKKKPASRMGGMRSARNRYSQARHSVSGKQLSKSAKHALIESIMGRPISSKVISNAKGLVNTCTSNRGAVVFRVGCQTPSAYYTKGKTDSRNSGSAYTLPSLKKIYKKNRRAYERRKYYKKHGTRMPKDPSRKKKRADAYVDLHSLW